MQQDQLPFLEWRRFKTKAPIKRIGCSIDEVGQQRPNAGLIGNHDGASNGVLQQAETQTCFNAAA